jgi:uncharacterized protein YkwD
MKHAWIGLVSVLAFPGCFLWAKDADTAPPADGSRADDGSALPAYCDPTSSWEAALAGDEAEVLRLINEHRAAGADCGTAGTFEAADLLTMEARLQCAARLHSLDMWERDYFDHDSPEGEDPEDRLAAVEYDWTTWGENILRGAQNPLSAVNGWMASDPHCSNIMHPAFEELGVGRYGDRWTLKFARPR